MLKDFLEKAFKYFDREPYLSEISNAKKEYFDRIGAVFETDNIFEMRMAAFFDWFLFQRPVSGVGLSPINIYYHSKAHELSSDEELQNRRLLKTIWSLFLIKARTRTGYELVDLFDGRSYQAPERNEINLIGMGKVIEARLVPADGGYVFSDPVCSHPLDATGRITKAASKLKIKSREEFENFIFRLAAMSIRLYRYRHLSVDKIYDLK